MAVSVAVVDVGSAVDAIRLLKDDDAGRAGLLVGRDGCDRGPDSDPRDDGSRLM